MTASSVRPPRPVQAAIAARRSVRRFRPEPVSREAIQRLLLAAVQAPNHRRTQPWRFFVLDSPGPVRAALTRRAREVALARGNPADAAAVARADAKATEVAETPVLLVVYAVPGRDAMETHENYAAVCCAVQNILLAAGEEDLAAGWSTGGICAEPSRLADILGADPTWTLTALLYVGAPDESQPPAAVRRNGPESFTTWKS
jgi:nitroreductase